MRRPGKARRLAAVLILLGLAAGIDAALAAAPLRSADPVAARRAAHLRGRRTAAARRDAAGAARRAAAARGSFAGFSDSGGFVHALDGRAVGLIAFRWQPDGSIESRTARGRAGIAGNRVRIQSDSSGQWRTVWLGVHRDTAMLERFGRRVALHTEGRVDTLALEPGTILHGPPVLLSQVPRVYDRRRGGVQTFPVLYLPLHSMRGTVEWLGSTTRPIGGAPQRFDLWRYEIPPAHDVLWTDARGRVCFVEDTTLHLSFVRTGYEALRDSFGAPVSRVAPPRAATPPRRDTLRHTEDSPPPVPRDTTRGDSFMRVPRDTTRPESLEQQPRRR